MQGPERPAWFVGDLADPRVSEIARRLPESFRLRSCIGELPDTWLTDEPPPGVVVLHRPILTSLDAQRIGWLRSRGDVPPRVVLCFGPHIRHDDLVRWSRLFDVTIPEATASETIRRIVDPTPRPIGPRPPVRVVSGLFDLRSLLVDVCRFAGYPVERAGDSPGRPARGLILWDLPVLEPGWPAPIVPHARDAAVIALLGFADRENVALARAAGAFACLEWPCDVGDLIDVLDRAAVAIERRQGEAGHVVPPSPVLIGRRGRAEVVDSGRSA